MVSAIDATKPIDSVPANKADLRANLAAAKSEIEALQAQVGVISPYVFSGMRNRVLNGNMRIDQRNAGVAIPIAPGVAPKFGSDRWYGVSPAAGGTFYLQNFSTGGPDGFPCYTRISVASPKGTLASGDVHSFVQAIEGYHWYDLMWGSASAASCTLSFWVRGSIAGSYAVALTNAAGANTYVASYSVNTANVWEYKTITVPGYTGGVWSTLESTAVGIRFDVGSGSTLIGSVDTWYASAKTTFAGAVALINTNSATLDITGVQLEPGSVATPYDYKLTADEYAMLKRYYTTGAFSFGGYYASAVAFSWYVQASNILRANPTIVRTGETISNLSVTSTSVNVTGIYFSGTSNVAGAWAWAGAWSADSEIIV